MKLCQGRIRLEIREMSFTGKWWAWSRLVGMEQASELLEFKKSWDKRSQPYGLNFVWCCVET